MTESFDIQNEPAADTPMVMRSAPIDNPAFPFFVYNAHKLPALLEAFSQAQGGYAKIIRDKLVVQRLKDKDSGSYSGREIKFLYAELSSILDAVIPSLSKYGLSFSQPVHQDATGTNLLTILAHKEGCVMITKLSLAGGEMKAFGGEITYIRRYMAGPALGVSAEDDAEDNGRGNDDDGEGGGGGNYGGREDREPERITRSQPVRRSASAPTTAGGINAGELANLNKKIQAANLTPEQVHELLAAIKVPAIGMSMTKEEWTAVKHAVEKAV